jgi:hypothetical protein
MEKTNRGVPALGSIFLPVQANHMANPLAFYSQWHNVILLDKQLFC